MWFQAVSCTRSSWHSTDHPRVLGRDGHWSRDDIRPGERDPGLSADGSTAYTKIEAAGPGDEVVIAPGTYAFRVYLQAQAPADKPIFIHAADPSNPPVWDLNGTLVDNAPGATRPGTRPAAAGRSGANEYHIDGIVIQNCHSSDADSAGLRYYNGTTGLLITNTLFKDNDNGVTGGTEDSEATIEFSEFDGNGNTKASSGSPTHNAYIYGGTFALRYSYLHDPLQAQNLHCRAVNSTIEYNLFDRATSYVGDLMTSDDYANNPSGALVQSMTLRGNVIIETAAQANQSQIWAVYNDEASGSLVPVLDHRPLQHGHRERRPRGVHPPVERGRYDDDRQGRRQHRLRDEPADPRGGHVARDRLRLEQLVQDGRLRHGAHGHRVRLGARVHQRRDE